MFTISQSIKIITIDQRYIKALYDSCSQVFYRPANYDNKPYIGILIEDNGRKYAIPLTSAKEKHKTRKNLDNGHFLVYENVTTSRLSPKDICVPNQDGSYKHILSVLVVPKMIPLKDGCYNIIDINPNINDTPTQKSYKRLLYKELVFCISNKERIIKEANRIYNKQVTTGRVYPGYCDFQVLEAVSDAFN